MHFYTYLTIFTNFKKFLYFLNFYIFYKFLYFTNFYTKKKLPNNKYYIKKKEWEIVIKIVANISLLKKFRAKILI